MLAAYIVSAKKLSDGGGIHIFRADENGLCKIGFTPCDLPSYITISGDSLYLISRGSDDKSFVSIFDISPDGSLVCKADHIPSNGSDGCYISVSGDNIFCANYGSGSLCRITKCGGAYKNVKTVLHTGRSIRADRQSAPYVHCTAPTGDGLVAACDLGCDRLAVYDETLGHIRDFYFPAGFGPRHIVFSRDHKNAFCIGELGVSVYALRYLSGGRFAALENYDLLTRDYPEDGRRLCTGAAIKLSPDGNYLAATARYANTVTLFRVSGGELSRRGTYFCGGDWPRDIEFSPDGKSLYCCLERSNAVSVFDLDADMTPRLRKTLVGIDNPLCITFHDIR